MIVAGQWLCRSYRQLSEGREGVPERRDRSMGSDQQRKICSVIWAAHQYPNRMSLRIVIIFTKITVLFVGGSDGRTMRL